MKSHGTRDWVYGLFKVGAGGRSGWYVDYFIMLLILANVFAVILETVDPIYAGYERQFFTFEVVSVVIFSVEYVGRLWSATEHPEYQHPVWGRLRYAVSPYMIIDLIAIAPFYLAAFVDLRFLRALRLLRFLRLLKITRYTNALQLFARVIRSKRSELTVTSIIGVILLLVASSSMYFAERTAQPEAFSSIPAAMWWGVITLTTVGYGDVTPVTTLGRVLGAAIAVIGIMIFALPASILAAGFIEASREELVRCPHCEQEIASEDLEQIQE